MSSTRKKTYFIFQFIYFILQILSKPFNKLLLNFTPVVQIVRCCIFRTPPYRRTRGCGYRPPQSRRRRTRAGYPPSREEQTIDLSLKIKHFLLSIFLKKFIKIACAEKNLLNAKLSTGAVMRDAILLELPPLNYCLFELLHVVPREQFKQPIFQTSLYNAHWNYSLFI